MHSTENTHHWCLRGLRIPVNAMQPITRERAGLYFYEPRPPQHLRTHTPSLATCTSSLNNLGSMDRNMERQPINAAASKSNAHKSTYVAETDDYDDEISMGGTPTCNTIATAAFCLTLPFSAVGACFVVQEKHHAVLLRCGKFENVETEPGCHFANPCGRSVTNISIARQTLELPKQKIVDHNGNPLLVSAIVTVSHSAIRAFALRVRRC
jgi:hypothetical protein